MAQDPYGYVEAATGEASGAASQAMWFGVASAIFASVGLCACYMPYFVASPLGIYAAYKGFQALNVATEARDRNMATAGLTAGIIAGLVSTMFVLFILAYVAFFVIYFIFIFLMVGVGAAGNF